MRPGIGVTVHVCMFHVFVLSLDAGLQADCRQGTAPPTLAKRLRQIWHIKDSQVPPLIAFPSHNTDIFLSFSLHNTSRHRLVGAARLFIEIILENTPLDEKAMFVVLVGGLVAQNTWTVTVVVMATWLKTFWPKDFGSRRGPWHVISTELLSKVSVEPSGKSLTEQ